MRYLTYALIFLLCTMQGANAVPFWIQSEKACVKAYVDETNSEKAAHIMYTACEHLFAYPPSEKISRLQVYKNIYPRYAKYSDEKLLGELYAQRQKSKRANTLPDKAAFYDFMDKITSDDYQAFSAKMNETVDNPDYQKYVVNKAWSRCALDRMKNVKTDNAALIIAQECYDDRN